jgi:hypothetical protein
MTRAVRRPESRAKVRGPGRRRRAATPLTRTLMVSARVAGELQEDLPPLMQGTPAGA